MIVIKHLYSKTISLFLIVVLTISIIPFSAFATDDNTKAEVFEEMLARAEAIVNYEWVPTQRIDTWNENAYNGRYYFEEGETVIGMPYTLFSWELGFDSLLSLNQYKSKASQNYSTTTYCNSVAENRTGPVYGSCCATFVSEVLGGDFMNGANPRYDGVGGIQNSSYGVTFGGVQLSDVEPGDALSNTVGSHIVWVGEKTDTQVTIYEQTPPVAIKQTYNIADVIDASGYFVLRGKTYNIVTRSNEMLGDDYSISTKFTLPIESYTMATGKTFVHAYVDGPLKFNKIYEGDLCVIDKIYDNGWCHVIFPLDAGGTDDGYVPVSTFFDYDCEPSQLQTETWYNVYRRSSLVDMTDDVIPTGAVVQVLGEQGNATQVMYSIDNTLRVGWIQTSGDPEYSIDTTYPTPLECRVLSKVKVPAAITLGGERLSNMNVYVDDDCIITEIYTNGWCKFLCPWSDETIKTLYLPLSEFIVGNVEPYTSIMEQPANIYYKPDLAEKKENGLEAGDSIIVVSTEGNLTQAIYQIDKGWSCGWLEASSNNVTYTISYDANGGLNAPGMQVIENNESINLSSDCPTREGYTFVGWSTDATATTAMYEAGDPYAANQDITLFAVWSKTTVNNSATLNVTSKTVRAGEEFTVNVNVENNPGFCYLKLRLVFDVNSFEFISANNGTVSTDSFATSNGALLWDADSNATVDGTLVTLSFKAKEDLAEGEYLLGVSFVEGYNYNEEDVLFNVNNATITVIDYVYGDVTGDNVINGKDLVRLRRYLLTLDETSGTADVEISLGADTTGDGVVNGKDLVRLRRYLLNFDEETGTSPIELGC